jgi:hypothetical protein
MIMIMNIIPRQFWHLLARHLLNETPHGEG